MDPQDWDLVYYIIGKLVNWFSDLLLTLRWYKTQQVKEPEDEQVNI